MLYEKQIQNNRYYIKSIAVVIQFLAFNELGFRGTFDEDLEKESGLFQNLFEFSIKNIKLKEIISSFSENAK